MYALLPTALRNMSDCC